VTPKSRVLVDLWLRQLELFISEREYMAELAGIRSSLSPSSDSLTFGFAAYNDLKGVKNYLGSLFRDFRNFKVDETHLRD